MFNFKSWALLIFYLQIKQFSSGKFNQYPIILFSAVISMFVTNYLCEMAQEIAEQVFFTAGIYTPISWENNPEQPQILSKSWFTLQIYFVNFPCGSF